MTAAALLLGACGDDDTAGGASTTSDGVTTEGGTSSEFAADAVDFPVDAAREKGGANSPAPRTDWLTVDPGTYVAGLLGTEVQFTTSDPWKVALAEDGALILEWPEVPRPFTRALLLLRPVEPIDGIDVYDAGGAWVDELDDVEVLDRREVTLGDTDAVRMDVTATDGAGNLNGEVPFLRSPTVGPIKLRDSEVARLWIIDQGGSPPTPMMFFAPVLTDDTEWLSEADAVVESMVFGPVQDPLDA